MMIYQTIRKIIHKWLKKMKEIYYFYLVKIQISKKLKMNQYVNYYIQRKLKHKTIIYINLNIQTSTES